MALYVYTVRKATLEVFLNGTLLNHVAGADWSGAFDQPYNECKVRLTQLPPGWNASSGQDQTLEIKAGNGTNHVRRFIGLVRSPVYDLSGYKTISGVSTLQRVYAYENSDDPTFSGGLFLEDLLGASTCTDQQAVQAVLGRVLVVGTDFLNSDIGGTGVVFAAGNGITPSDDAYFWGAGDSPEGIPETQSAGESALSYIYRWDQVSAVAQGVTWSPAGSEYTTSSGAITGQVGFYRTFQTMQGKIVRSLIGGRPRGTPTIATPFTEGVDIRTGQITRGYPTANRYLVVGMDFGGVDSSGQQQGPVRFVLQSSNPYMPSTMKVTAPAVNSPMIEKQAENDWAGGMSCEKVCYALEPESNRVIVSGNVTSSRDDYVSPGATILVQGPGGTAGVLGTGENLWVKGVQGSVGANGFQQTFSVLGGGVPDNYLPAVPQ